jgi:hypothetical protein
MPALCGKKGRRMKWELLSAILGGLFLVVAAGFGGELAELFEARYIYKITCRKCNGYGFEDGTEIDNCETCDGLGYEQFESWNDKIEFTSIEIISVKKKHWWTF